MKIVKQLCLATLAAVCLAIGLIAVVEADPGGRAWGYGYFTNAGQFTGVGGQVIRGGAPDSTSKSVFINFIKNKLSERERDSNNKLVPTRDSTGAAFIIQTMRGSTDHNTPSSADVADWEDRLNDPSVTITLGDFSYSWNSAYMKGFANDDTFYPYDDSRYSLIFKVNGTISYVLKQDCANPVGDLAGLPKSSNKWGLSASSTANKTIADPGDTITWTHKLTNGGPDATDKIVNYGYKNSGGLGTGSTKPNVLPSGSSVGTTTFTTTHVVSSADVGDNLCRSTIASPKAWNDSAQLESTSDCVSIPLRWTISATSSAQVGSVAVTSAKPGDTITWIHKLNNNGPNATTKVVYSDLALTGFTNGWASTLLGANTPSGKAAGLMRTINGAGTIHTVTQDDVGNTLCEKVRYNHTSDTNDADGTGNNSCVSVPYNYNLTPSVTTGASNAVEADTTVTVSPKVDNSGPTKSKATNWQLTQLIVQPSSGVPGAAGGDSALAPCAPGTYFQGAGATCLNLASGTNTVFNTGITSLAASSAVVGDVVVGTKLCFALSVQPRAHNSDQWRHSAPVCLVVGKKPKTQVHGGDLAVGKAFSGSTPSTSSTVQTSTSVKSDNTFGSWIEYGIFATGSVTGAASGSGYAGISGMASATVCKASKLSFALATSNPNCVNTSPIGAYKSNRSIPDVAANFPIDVSTPVLGTNDLSDQSKQGLYTSGNLTLNGGTIEKGRWLVLNAPGATVTINGDIRYTSDPLKSIGEIPQLVIIANKIIINDNVTNVDAWLIANGPLGIIETCNTGSLTYALSAALKLTASKCKDLLTINGPVMAKQLWLRRTAGSGIGPASGDPAEIFNLRSDAYLWASARAVGNGRVQTVYTTELPPRL